jgi:hypothetical protein
MNDRAHTRWLGVPALIVMGALATAPLAGQVKVLTPPRPADTTSRAATTAGRSPAATQAAPGTVARPAPVIPQSPVLDSIREVVFRNLLEHDRAGFSTFASAFCLGLSADDFKKPSTLADRADPPEGMVRRVSASRTPARRASTCTFAPNVSAPRPVAGRALLYSVGAIDLSASDRAEAAAAYSYDGYSAGGYTFSVERADSGWVIKQWRMEWTARSSTP